METSIVQEERALYGVATALLKTLPPSEYASVIALQGDLGAGKTAFTKALAHVLGVLEHVTSPTFVIMKSYAVPHHERFDTLTHIDAYRIEDSDELRVLGFIELLQDPKRLIVIEWPERIGELIPQSALTVQISITDTTARRISYGN